ncbi:YgfZ/GcvT domain-containing protein [Minwuia thermotolerans]|uniref:Folate-binding protein n=1 Tax=Minwuia thermotolerans TaxID=2056226 RepID=A0A2M9FVX9_9PROT|nr:folate-binding protein YgfZ [Minwuia thermotolerans]PJK27607.1 folate-binding protein [Minwuia thermotolerans]
MTATEPTHVKLPNRGVLSVAGAEAESFLQNLVSNNVAPASPETGVYATLLTPQGKFLHDFFVVRDGEGAILLDCEADRLEDLKRRLTLYKLRAKVELADVSAGWTVIALLAGSAGAPIEFQDPRHADMGRRALLPAGADIPGEERPFADYERRRLECGVPDGSRDMEVERSFLLENRIDEFHGIDFKKGCYVGQELTARTKYRGNVRKRLTPVTVDGELPDPGTPVTIDGKEVGAVRSGLGDRALAMLRIERPDGELRAGETRLTPL